MKTSRKKTPLRFVVPPPVPLGKKCHVVQHKKFSQKFTRTKKRRIQRLRAMEKRKLPEEMPQIKQKETENLKQEVRRTANKTKFGKRATKDDESSCGSKVEMDLTTIMISKFPVSLKCSTISLTLLDFFKLKEMEESLVEVEKEHSQVQEKHS